MSRSTSEWSKSAVLSLLAAAAVIPLLAALVVPPPVSAQTYDQRMFGEMRWRSIGPYRAGRTRAVAGVPSQPNVFYMGVCNGGVWKTNDYGRTWRPIFDDQPTGSIGAIAVAPSNPDIVYVASGEGLQRPDLSVGDGIYKSTDAGRTWTHLGLRDGQQIPQIIVDPHDADRVFAAVLGHPYGPNEERGIYRSLDGGKSFERVLYVDENTGGSEVAFDPSDPAIVYAGLWESRQGPWENAAWSGANGGLYKSTDGGTTWRKLDLPEPVVQINLGIAPSDPRRIYAAVALARGTALFRSDDSGAAWTRLPDTRPAGRIGGGDLPRIAVHPADPDTLFVAATVSYKSTDGGKTFRAFKGAPGGDDYQNIWINPANPRDPSLRERPGRRHHGERRGDLELLVQPADGPALSRRGRQRLPLPRLQRPAGKRLGRRPEPRRRRPDHLPRLADGRRRRVRLRRARPARPGHRLRRPERHALGPAHRTGPDGRPQGFASGGRRLADRAHPAGPLLARRPADALLRGEHSLEDARRRPVMDPDQPGPHAQDLGGAGERRQVQGRAVGQARPARRHLHGRPVLRRCQCHLGRHGRRPHPCYDRRRPPLDERHAASAHALGQGLGHGRRAVRRQDRLRRGQHHPARRHEAAHLPDPRRRQDLDRDRRGPARRRADERCPRGPRRAAGSFSPRPNARFTCRSTTAATGSRSG